MTDFEKLFEEAKTGDIFLTRKKGPAMYVNKSDVYYADEKLKVNRYHFVYCSLTNLKSGYIGAETFFWDSIGSEECPIYSKVEKELQVSAKCPICGVEFKFTPDIVKEDKKHIDCPLCAQELEINKTLFDY